MTTPVTDKPRYRRKVTLLLNCNGKPAVMDDGRRSRLDAGCVDSEHERHG